MTDNINKIGIAIWGVKGGFRVFCSQGIDIRNDEVMNTMKDIRNFIRINNAAIDFYALEFTHQYKVYTLYRSVDESNGRSGAFIAITVFVPHPLRFMELRSLLVEMMDAYFKEYIDPVSNMPLAGKYDDITPFVILLSKHQAQIVGERGHFLVKPSEQNNLPKVFPYASLDVVDKFFDTPYRPEFYNCQEVMFLDEKLVNNPTLHNVIFGIIFHRFDPERIGEQVRTGILDKFNYPDFSLVLFKKNGEDILDTYPEYGFLEEDRIELRLFKPYHQDIFFQGTLGEAIENGIFIKKEGNYKLVMPRFAERQYILPVVIEGIDAERIKDIVLKLFIDKMPATAVESRYDEREGGLYFVIQGKSVTKVHRISYKWGDSFFTWGKQVRPEEILKSEGQIVIHLKKYVFWLAEGQESTYEGKCYISGASVPFRFTENNRTFSVWLPDDDQFADVSFDFKAEGYTSSIDAGGAVSFMADFVKLSIQLSSEIPSEISKGLVFVYRIGEKEYHSQRDGSTGVLYFKLPKRGEERVEGNLFLLLDNDSCECEGILTNCSIYPKVKLYDIHITNLSGEITYQIRTSNKKIEYIANSDTKKILVPQGAYIAGVSFSGNSELLMKDGNLFLADNGLLEKQTIRIYTKDVCEGNTSSVKSTREDSKTVTKKIVEEKPLASTKLKDTHYVLYSKLGEGYTIPLRVGKQNAKNISLKKVQDINAENLTKDHSLLVGDESGNLECRIPFPYNKNEAERFVYENFKKYKVTWDQNESEEWKCVLERRKRIKWNKYFSKEIKDKINKIFFLSIVSLAFIVLLSVLAVWFRSEQPVAAVTIQVNQDAKIKNIEPVGFGMQTKVLLDSMKIYLYDKKITNNEIALTGEEKVKIIFDGEGMSEYEIESFKNKTWKSVKEGYQDFELLVISSPGRAVLEKEDCLSIKDYREYADEYFNLEKDFAEKAWRIWSLAKSSNDSLLKDYRERFADYHRAEVDTLLKNISRDRQAAEEKANKIEYYQKLWDSLNRMTCSMNDVNKVKEEFHSIDEDILKNVEDSKRKEALSPFLVDLKLKAYEIYFNNISKRGAIDSLKFLEKRKSCFTDEQYEVIELCWKDESGKGNNNRFKLLIEKNFKTFEQVKKFVKEDNN